MTTETVGQRIARLRRARGWTQYDLAAAVGVYRWTVGRWECGGRVLRAEHLIRLSDVLGVDPTCIWRGCHA